MWKRKYRQPAPPGARVDVRLVLDTNTVLSGLLWRNAPRRLIDAAREQRFLLYSSPALMAELTDVLSREKFAARLLQEGLTPAALVADYAGIVRFLRPAHVPQVISRDPDDDHVLACALAAEADAIVTGDGDLLALRPAWNGIAILTVREVLDRLDGEN